MARGSCVVEGDCLAGDREARRLKNPRRVGADFHLKVASLADDDDDW